MREILPRTHPDASNGPVAVTSHRLLVADPQMVEAALALQADKPLSYQKPVSQVARELIHVETITGPDGEVTQAPRLNRKGRRKADALERRKFKPATRPLNRHERQQMLLNKYEDSLEAKKPLSSRRKKKKRSQVPAIEQPPVEQSRFRRMVQRATERALSALSL